jgi:hypothetical protein
MMKGSEWRKLAVAMKEKKEYEAVKSEFRK